MTEKCVGTNAVQIYLETWQQRMVNDILGIDCESWTVPCGVNIGLRYMPPLPTIPGKGPRMYFTDWQRNLIRDATGCACDFTELVRNNGGLVRYRVPPEKLTDKHREAASALGANTFLSQK